MISNLTRMQRILLLIFIIALISLGTLIISELSNQGRLTGLANNVSTIQASSTPVQNYLSGATSTNCTVTVLAPEYSPKHFYPPSIIIYDSRPFLINWTVVNTGEDCVWLTLQLLTTENGQLKILNLMSSDRSLPKIDEEFGMADKDNLPVKQVNPRQRVTITVQIDGLELVSSNGKLDRTFDMVVNGQLADGGKLIARQSQWVVVILPSNTPTNTLLPGQIATVTPTETLTETVSPTSTRTIAAFLTWTPTAPWTSTPGIPVSKTRTPTSKPLPPITPTSTFTSIPTTAVPSNTPTLALPPIDTPTLSNP